MFCSNCGKENEAGAKFCEYCGNSLIQKDNDTVTSVMSVENSEEKQGMVKSKKKNKIWIIICLFLLLTVSAVAGGIALKNQKIQERYNNAVETGQKYLEELDYEQAEDAYLQAIEIDSKKKEPYVKLIEIYIDQGDYDKVLDIAEDAKENVPEEDQPEFEEIIDIWKNAEKYEWIVEPEIEANDIDYLCDGDVWLYASNDLLKQMESTYAVIKRGDSYSLINLDGELLDELVYKRVEVNGTEYVLIRKEPRYEEEYDMEWELYGFDEETGDIFPGRYYDSAPYFGGTFYYFDGTAHNSLEADTSGFSYNMVSIPEHAIPIQQSDIQPDPESIWEFENNLSGKYAIYCKDKLITDFEYDQCGSSVSGLLAVEKDGKWGYINEEGHIVIPIEYDSSWKLRYEMGDLEYENDEENEFCYAVSNGYVPLVKNGEWELRHTDGTLAIPAGVFETIRPVQETSYEKSRLN